MAYVSVDKVVKEVLDRLDELKTEIDSPDGVNKFFTNNDVIVNFDLFILRPEGREEIVLEFVRKFILEAENRGWDAYLLDDGVITTWYVIGLEGRTNKGRPVGSVVTASPKATEVFVNFYPRDLFIFPVISAIKVAIAESKRFPIFRFRIFR